MKKLLLKYISIVSIAIILILNSSISIYGYSILGDDKILNILVIRSYGSKDEWEMNIFKGLSETLKKLKPDDLELNIKHESLDIRERNDREYLNSFNELLNTKYQNKDIDLVFTIDDEAFEFAKSQVLNPKSILYHKKILFVGVDKDVDITGEYKEYISGIALANKEALLFNMILYLHPNVDTINVILDDLSYSEVVKERALSSEKLLFKDVNINFIQSNYIEDIEEKLKKFNGKNQANLITGTFISKSEKSYINSRKVVQDIKDITNNPLYTNTYAYIDSGVIGGYIDIAEKQGEYAAKEIYNILYEKKSKENILQRPTAKFIFDYKEIYKYNIDTFRIPKDRIILNKPIFALLLPKPLKNVVYVSIILIILIGIYGSNRIIKEKQKSRKNKQLYEKTKEREQLKTDFIVNMSHEFRTPLNVILSTSKVAELKINKNDYDNKYLLDKLEQINKNSNRL